MSSSMRREAATPMTPPEQPAEDAAPDRFQQAVTQAQSLASPAHWQTLSPADRTRLIYRQLRRLDALALQAPAPKPGRASLNA
jgi:hypothetical protein